MIEGIPSQTALGVALARALASLPESGLTAGHDTWAKRLLPRPYRALIGTAEKVYARVPFASTALGIASLGLTTHAGLRTAAIDAALEEALARGVRQLVVLGAGLDARAYRVPALAGSTVFEVDHPSTQAWKKKRIRDAVPLAARVAYVSMDFAKDSLDAKLAEAGHDREAPTVWIWEGVTMYLPESARAASLRIVAKRSARGSRLVTTYAEPTLSTLPLVSHRVVQAFFATLGEPLIGLVSRDAFARELRASGFSVVSDAGTREWAELYARGKQPLVGLHERVVVADRP